MYNLQDIIKKLPKSIFSHDINSNIGKILDLFVSELNEINIAREDVKKLVNINFNFGKNLDNFGANFLIPRAGRTDEEYRTAIKIYFNLLKSPGTLNSMIEFLAFFLGVDNNRIIIEESLKDFGSFTGIKHKIIIIKPFVEDLINAGITADQFFKVAKKIKPAGTGLKLFIDGTFKFSDNPTESTFNSDFGFDEGLFSGLN